MAYNANIFDTYDDPNSNFSRGRVPLEKKEKEKETGLDTTKTLYTRLGLKVTKIEPKIRGSGFIGRIEGSSGRYSWAANGKSVDSKELDISNQKPFEIVS